MLAAAAGVGNRLLRGVCDADSPPFRRGAIMSDCRTQVPTSTIIDDDHDDGDAKSFANCCKCALCAVLRARCEFRGCDCLVDSELFLVLVRYGVLNYTEYSLRIGSNTGFGC